MNSTVEMLNAELCMCCGICKGVCMRDAISYKRNEKGQYIPEIDHALCNQCGNCYEVCPGKGIPEHDIYKSLGQPMPEDWIRGNIKECFNGRIVDEELRKKCTAGGMVTDIIQYLLKKEIYDVAFCVEDSSYEEQVCTKPQYADSDFVKTAQSRYIVIAHTDMIKYILKNRDKKVIIVGCGCVAAGVRSVIERYHLKKENYLILGLFCDMSLNYNVYDYMKLFDKRTLQKCEFRSKENGIYKYGNVKLIYHNGSSRFLHFARRSYLKSYMFLERCLYCTDLLATFSDVAFGDNNTASGDGESTTVIVRTVAGEHVMEQYPMEYYQKEIIEAEKIVARRTYKDRKKRKIYADIYAEEHYLELYPDREKELLDKDEYVQRKQELYNKLRKQNWANKRKNIKKLYWFLQLKMLRYQILKKDLLKPMSTTKI